MSKRTILATAAAASFCVTAGLGGAQAAEPQECQSVGIASVNWTGVSVKSHLMQDLLESLGYEVTLTTASVPIAFQAVGSGERDFFLGLWLPTQQSMIQPFLEDGKVEKVRANLEGAKYTLAVPEHVYNEGVEHFSDLDEHKAKFDGRILGIEAGNDGNLIIQDMIDKDAYGLGDWELMASSEAGMLTQVKRSMRNEDWVVYLGWAPHPMTRNIDMKFLEGGEDFFGPDQGGATVHTIASTGYTEQCPNVGRLLEQFSVSVDDQSLMGDYVLNEGMDYSPAAKQFVQQRPEKLAEWLDGVKTADGSQDALPVAKKAMGVK
ncbi:glycine betaine ABC transporter substrate-binding protein [Arhodomonas sp. AD133]|uniref:glycine betaine ABC transporter substrate-binding protein n=1 Tax=Arhodomonas sp. AD133 TaxID=3415009 RepID=UPI003EBFD1CD